jgi:roadblock/LC7 domain-containing protein
MPGITKKTSTKDGEEMTESQQADSAKHAEVHSRIDRVEGYVRHVDEKLTVLSNQMSGFGATQQLQTKTLQEISSKVNAPNHTNYFALGSFCLMLMGAVAAFVALTIGPIVKDVAENTLSGRDRDATLVRRAEMLGEIGTKVAALGEADNRHERSMQQLEADMKALARESIIASQLSKSNEKYIEMVDQYGSRHWLKTPPQRGPKP